MAKTKEIWKPIKGYEGYYDVSNLGRVRSLPRMVPNEAYGLMRVEGKLKKATPDNSGFLRVGLFKDNRLKMVAIKNLVAETFIENPDDFKYVKCIDGDKNNNAAENLEWSEHMGNYGMKRRYTKKTVETPKFEVVAPATVEEKPVVPVRKKVKVFRRNPFSAHSYRLGTLLLQR